MLNAEDEEERALYSRVRGTCVTKYPYPKKKKKLKEENWNVTVVEWQPKTVRTIVGTAAVGATSFLTVECWFILEPVLTHLSYIYLGHYNDQYE